MKRNLLLIIISCLSISVKSQFFPLGILNTGGAGTAPSMPATASTTVAADGVTLIPSGYVISSCTFTTVGAEWGYSNIQFQPSPQSVTSPLAFITRIPNPLLTGSCLGTTWNTKLDLSTGSKKPTGLCFELADVDNSTDSLQLLVYYGGSLINYTYTVSTGTFVKIYNIDGTLNTGGGTNLWFNGTGINNAAPNNVDYDKGIVKICPTASSSIDSIIVKRFIFTSTGASASISIGNFIWASTILPLQLFNHTISYSNNTVVNNWEIENEINVKEHQIWRSTNGIHFEKIGTTIAKNLSKSMYNFIDNISNIPSNIFYYKIVSINKSESILESKIISISTKKNTYFNISPNPANSFININISGSINEDAIITIASVEGKILLTKRKRLIIGNQHIEITDLDKLPSGTFFIKIKTNSFTKSLKFLIL